MKRIYLDNASITPLDKRVQKEVNKYESVHVGNPSSLHKEGVLAKKALDEARKGIAQFLNAHGDEIVFTASGTEANNLAIFGIVNELMKSGRKIGKIHLVTSEIEHPSVLECFLELERRGAKVDYIPVLPNGIIDISKAKEKITKDTALVSLMYVNNEIGTIQPVMEVAKIIRRVRKDNESSYPLFHTDASQAVLYLEMNVEKLGVDLLTLDSHKVYGPKGIGALYVKRGISIEPVMYGGGQENGRRSGTSNIPGVIGFNKALQIAQYEKEKETERLTTLRNYFLEKLVAKHRQIILNGDLKDRIAYNINISIPGYDTEFLVLQLDARGIACSTKSSCLRDEDESYVIKALVRNQNRDPKNSIRFSFGRFTTRSEVNKALKEIDRLLSK